MSKHALMSNQVSKSPPRRIKWEFPSPLGVYSIGSALMFLRVQISSLPRGRKVLFAFVLTSSVCSKMRWRFTRFHQQSPPGCERVKSLPASWHLPYQKGADATGDFEILFPQDLKKWKFTRRLGAFSAPGDAEVLKGFGILAIPDAESGNTSAISTSIWS